MKQIQKVYGKAFKLMKIVKIIPYVLNENLEKEFFFSQWEYSNRKICIVKVICDNGIVGWGEAYGPAPVLSLIHI